MSPTACPSRIAHALLVDWRAVDDLLAAASAALGVTLTEPTDLGGSERSAARRCRRPDGGSVVVKSYPGTEEGTQSFVAEAAGLAFTAGAGVGPRLLAASKQDRLIVMSDLGSWPSLADHLLAGSADAARAAVLGWARACGELAAGTAGRRADFAALLAAHGMAPAAGQPRHWLERKIGQIPGLLRELAIPVPPGLPADLDDLASVLRTGRYEVFSPGDICPDNNLLTGGGGSRARVAAGTDKRS